ncbi:methyl-accepting chemotaxis protein [Halovivax sp.]|uniref:methyl-accepting chemotaxis protein n=1 Tax=Halovivax sp. TaxID=1935978 RepID=UPI0025C3C647|nr:methyl-accepting chemotaxis protein [Halovivax sp.]
MIDHLRKLVPPAIRRSYALKFGIALLVLGLSVGLIGFLGTTMIADSVENSTLEDQEILAAQEASALDDWNDQNARMTSDVAGAIAEIDDEERIRGYVNGLEGDVEGVHLVAADTGEFAASTRENASSLDDVNFPDEDEISFTQSQVQRTDAYWSDDDPDERQPVMAYYAGIGGEYALIVTVDLADYGHDIGGTGATVVVNEAGEIVADSRQPGFGHGHGSFLAEYEDSDGFLADALGGEDADHSGAAVYDGPASQVILDSPYDFSEGEYIGAHHSTEMGWTVLSHTSTDDAFGFVNTVSQYGMYATLAGVLLIGLIGAVIGRNTATSIDRLTGKVAEMEEGNLDVEFESKRIDNIGRLYDGFAAMRDELKLQITEAEEARAEAEQERERVQRINDDLQQAATAYCGVMEEAADGDLTARMDPDATDNETMRAIGEDFNAMLTEIEATVENLNQFATEVATASEEVTASSEEVRSASEQVSESVQEISDGADKQFDSLRSVDSEMNNLSTTTEQIAASSNQVADVAERTARTGRDGREAAREAVDAVDELEEERKAVVAEFEQLREEVDQIDDLVERVGEIAEQTNMLALNANIEASRSAGGDDDGGFAAVAAEVKELSQDVKAATEEIDDRLEGIQDQTERSAEEVERTSEEIEHVGELVTDTVGALEEIAEYAQETNDGVQEISAATEEQAASTQEVVAMVDEVATISEETTSQAESVAAAAEEQTTAMTEVSNSANDLTQQAMSLSEALDRFDTDADPDDSFVDLDAEPADDESAVGDDAEETFTFEADDGADGPGDGADGPDDDDAAADDAVGNAGITEGGATWDSSDEDDDDRTFTLDS